MRPLEALRILLGAVMALTAVQYFMPFLLDLPTARWNDPLASRLMLAFERSGLLAVAKFIHLAAGALLLARRAVPFALAALMPVNLCGLFIALIVEGDVIVGLLAVLTVALNALLMFAHLSAYRGILAGGQLADGERPEPGGTFESLFVMPQGQAPLRSYAAGAALLLAALAFYAFVVPFTNGTTGLVTLAVPAMILAIGAGRALLRTRAQARGMS
jgi:hypothetical protein